MDFEKEYNELKEEFERLWKKLYLSEEENKTLKKEIKKLEKEKDKSEKNTYKLLGIIYDYAARLGETPHI